MKAKALRILQYLVIALYLGYYSESTLFFHTHTFAWGTVTHSHPYMPSGGHSHSQVECQTITSLANILSVVAGAVVVAAVFSIGATIYTFCLRSFVKHFLEHCSLRAPPVSFC